MKEETTGRGVLKRISKINVNNGLHCPHDLSRNEFRDDLPTILGNKGLKIDNKSLLNEKLPLEEETPGSLILANKNVCVFDKRELFKKIHGFAFLSLYQRYQVTKQCLQNKEKQIKQELEEQAANEVEMCNQPVIENQSQETCDTERTDEERIASVILSSSYAIYFTTYLLQIRVHFLQLSQKFSKDLEIQKKAEKEKEKQDEHCKRKIEHISETPNHGHHAIEAIPFKLNMRGLKNKGKKRKFSEIDRQAATSANINQAGNGQPRPRKERNNKFKNKQQMDNTMEAQMNECLNKQSPRKKRRHPNSFIHKKAQQQNSRTNQEKQFVPYDYASVDFRQFQGGAGSATGAVQIKPKFKGKVRRE